MSSVNNSVTVRDMRRSGQGPNPTKGHRRPSTLLARGPKSSHLARGVEGRWGSPQKGRGPLPSSPVF
ncbi:hypothetical protein CRG98_003902 [Punica granatum]|uniref:Uncharacterized protein n=1 Tax=Punica granatum TaxID=22663 RepID=A0A2I0L4T5_PUNGR|nr:hypothetical protein CRG98_003902 [Punica granatum]